MNADQHPPLQDPFYANADRATRRMVLAAEKRERVKGRWTPLTSIALPDGQTHGDPDPKSWLRDLHTVFKNEWLCVMVRDCATDWGVVKHAFYVTASRTELIWPERMKLKDMVFGPEAIALEVLPARSHLIDAANVYHLWVLPPAMALPFGLHGKDPCSERHYRPTPSGE